MRASKYPSIDDIWIDRLLISHCNYKRLKDQDRGAMQRQESSTYATLACNVVVSLVLLTQASLLAYSATRHSPTHLEPAFRAAGVSHWQFGSFDLYRVNPPLPRMLPGLVAQFVGCETDWSHATGEPGSRPEFLVGDDFAKANGNRIIDLIIYARWACIPFGLLGTYFAFRWATELYGAEAGLATSLLMAFEPNLLAHAELITPDAACTCFGIAAGYAFWSWLRKPTWLRCFACGVILGLAVLTKFTWLILFASWPASWLLRHQLTVLLRTVRRDAID